MGLTLDRVSRFHCRVNFRFSPKAEVEPESNAVRWLGLTVPLEALARKGSGDPLLAQIAVALNIAAAHAVAALFVRSRRSLMSVGWRLPLFYGVMDRLGHDPAIL